MKFPLLSEIRTYEYLTTRLRLAPTWFVRSSDEAIGGAVLEPPCVPTCGHALAFVPFDPPLTDSIIIDLSVNIAGT